MEWLSIHLNSWGYYLLFVMVFFETAAFVGFLVPGESMVVVAGFLASQHVLDIGDVMWVASLAAVTGDTVGYLIGLRFGKQLYFRYGRYFFLKPHYLTEAREFFAAHGGKAVFLGRLTAWLRALTPFVAGVSRMGYFHFLVFNMAGGIAWAVAFTLVGYFFGNSWHILKTYLGWVGAVFFALVVAVIYLYSRFRRRKLRLIQKLGEIDARLAAEMPACWTFIKDRFRLGEFYGLTLTVALFFLTLAILGFGGIVDAVLEREGLFHLDRQVHVFFETHSTPITVSVMTDVSHIGSLPVLLSLGVATAIYLALKHKWWDFFGLGLVAGVGELLLAFLKLSFHRPRSLASLVTVHGYSFPSGHAFFVMVMFGFIAYIAWTSRRVLFRWLVSVFVFVIVVLVGISRIYLDAHWLSDVLAGYSLGFAWLVFSLLLVNTVRYRYEKSR